MVELVLEIHRSSCNFYTDTPRDKVSFCRSVIVTVPLWAAPFAEACHQWAFPPSVSLATLVWLALVWAVHVSVYVGKLDFCKFCQITIFLKYVFPT